MRKLIAVLMLAAAIASPAHALKVGETFQVKPGSNIFSCHSVVELMQDSMRKVNGLWLPATDCGPLPAGDYRVVAKDKEGAFELCWGSKGNNPGCAWANIPARAESTELYLSEKCTREILNRQISPECNAEGKRWSAELDRKLADPEWRRQLIDKLSRPE
jgi:hypothetical protein